MPKDLRAMRLHGLQVGRPLVGPEICCLELVGPERQRFPLGRFGPLTEELVELGVERLHLTGSPDPLGYPDLGLVIDLAREAGLEVHLTSNGLTGDPRDLARWDLADLELQIPAVDEDSYLKRFPRGRLEDWLALLSRLAQLRDRGVHSTHRHQVDRFTLEGLPAMVRMAHQYRARRLLVDLPFGEVQDSTALGEEELDRLLQCLPGAIEMARRLGIRTNLGGLRNRFRIGASPDLPIAAVGCRMGFYYARITADGRLLYCDLPELEMGRLDDGVGFTRSWTGSSWQSERSRRLAHRFRPGCRSCSRFDHNRALRLRSDRARG